MLVLINGSSTTNKNHIPKYSESKTNSNLKADLHSANDTRATDAIRSLVNCFFNLHLRRTKCSVYLTNLLFLLTTSSH